MDPDANWAKILDPIPSSMYLDPQHLVNICFILQETYQKFKANPPARIKRKAERQRQEREIEEKRRRLNQDRAAQGENIIFYPQKLKQMWKN